MSEPFLILHKVRGEPAFDIAVLFSDIPNRYDDKGRVKPYMDIFDDEEPGPWWIITTSGRRCDPAHAWRLDSLLEPNILGSLNLEYIKNPQLVFDDDKWASWPDHYPPSRLATAASDILSLMGIEARKPAEPVKRRVIP